MPLYPEVLLSVYHSGADLSSAPGSVDRGADEGALEAGLGQLIFALIQVLPGQDLFGALLGGLGAGLVDLLGPLPGGSDQMDIPVQHGEHPAHEGGAAALAVRVHNMGFAHTQRGAVITMLCQNGKVAVDGTADHPFRLPESAFLFAGTIDDVFAKAKKG